METTPAYPDICFAVDDFDSTFDAVVITLFYPIYFLHLILLTSLDMLFCLNNYLIKQLSLLLALPKDNNYKDIITKCVTQHCFA